MKTLDSGHYALTCVVVALLAGCGGSQPPIGAGITRAGTQARSHHRTFKYTKSEQSFKVPVGVTSVAVSAKGAAGAQGAPSYVGTWSSGGSAGSVDATIPVAPGERLAIFVGGSGIRGGFNGGAARFEGSCSKICYGSGGGASDVRQGASDLPTALWWPPVAEVAAAMVASARRAATLRAETAETEAETRVDRAASAAGRLPEAAGPAGPAGRRAGVAAAARVVAPAAPALTEGAVLAARVGAEPVVATAWEVEAEAATTVAAARAAGEAIPTISGALAAAGAEARRSPRAVRRTCRWRRARIRATD